MSKVVTFVTVQWFGKYGLTENERYPVFIELGKLGELNENIMHL